LTYYLELEIDNELDVPTIIDTTNRGVRLTLAEKANSGLEFLVRNLQAIAHLVHGKNCRVRFGTDPVKANNPIVFEGTMVDIDRSGTFKQFIPIMARDKFKDRCLSKIVQLKHGGETGPATIMKMPFDATFDDFSGNENHGAGNFHDKNNVFSNGIYHEGVIFKSTIANSEKDHITVYHDNSMKQEGSQWFSFWVVHGEHPVDKAGIFGKGYHRGNKSGPFAYVESDGKITFGYGTGDTVHTITSNTAGQLLENITGDYVHVVIEYDDLNKTLKMWSAVEGDLGPSKDLLLRKSQVNVPKPYPSNKDPMLFGALSLQDPADFLQATTDDIEQADSNHWVGDVVLCDPYRNYGWVSATNYLALLNLETGELVPEHAYTVSTSPVDAIYKYKPELVYPRHIAEWGGLDPILGCLIYLNTAEEVMIFYYETGSVLNLGRPTHPDGSANTWASRIQVDTKRHIAYIQMHDTVKDHGGVFVIDLNGTPNIVNDNAPFNHLGPAYEPSGGSPAGINKSWYTQYFWMRFWENGNQLILASNDGGSFHRADCTNALTTGIEPLPDERIPFFYNGYFNDFDIDQENDIMLANRYVRNGSAGEIVSIDLHTGDILKSGSLNTWNQSYRVVKVLNNGLVYWQEGDGDDIYIYDYLNFDNMPLVKAFHWQDTGDDGDIVWGHGSIWNGFQPLTGKMYIYGYWGQFSSISSGGSATQAHWYGKLDEFHWFNGKSTQLQREELHYPEYANVNGGADPFKEVIANIIGQIGPAGEFNADGVENNLENSPIDFPYWMGDEAFDDLAQSLGCTYYHEPDGTINFFRENTRSSGLTITEDMVRDVGQIKNSIANSVVKVVVIGAEDAEGNRIIGTSELSSPDTKILGREKAIHDKTITSYARAKALAKFVLRQEGKVTLDIPPLFIRNLDPLPNPTETVILNLPSVGIVGTEVTVREIEIKAEEGTDNIEWIKLSFGQKQLGLIDRVTKAERREASTQRIGNNESQPTNTEQTSNIKDMITVDTTFNAPTENTTTFDNIDGFQLDTGIGNNEPFGLDGGTSQSELDA
jgi:hypothetical protein